MFCRPSCLATVEGRERVRVEGCQERESSSWAGFAAWRFMCACTFPKSFLRAPLHPAAAWDAVRTPSALSSAIFAADRVDHEAVARVRPLRRGIIVRIDDEVPNLTSFLRNLGCVNEEGGGEEGCEREEVSLGACDVHAVLPHP